MYSNLIVLDSTIVLTKHIQMIETKDMFIVQQNVCTHAPYD